MIKENIFLRKACFIFSVLNIVRNTNYNVVKYISYQSKKTLKQLSSRIY